MTAARQTAAPGGAASKPQKMVGEWFWRFLAVVMVATVGWALWILYQINPPSLITDAGFAAAAKARASQDARGVITPAGAPVNARLAADRSNQAQAAKSPVQVPLAEPKEPPVNAERLRLADSIETPIPERGRKK
jgi:hypothetical protein